MRYLVEHNDFVFGRREQLRSLTNQIQALSQSLSVVEQLDLLFYQERFFLLPFLFLFQRLPLDLNHFIVSLWHSAIGCLQGLHLYQIVRFNAGILFHFDMKLGIQGLFQSYQWLYSVVIAGILFRHPLVIGQPVKFHGLGYP